LKEQGLHINFWDAFKISFKMLLTLRPHFDRLVEKSVPVSPSPSSESASANPSDADQIIAEHLQKQPNPWDHIFDERHLNEVLNPRNAFLALKPTLSHDALYESYWAWRRRRPNPGWRLDTCEDD
jgi:hypothetical protein